MYSRLDGWCWRQPVERAFCVWVLWRFLHFHLCMIMIWPSNKNKTLFNQARSMISWRRLDGEMCREMEKKKKRRILSSTRLFLVVDSFDSEFRQGRLNRINGLAGLLRRRCQSSVSSLFCDQSSVIMRIRHEDLWSSAKIFSCILWWWFIPERGGVDTP